MKPRALVIIALLLLAPAAAYFFLPGANERISMLIREGKDREAAAALRRLLKAGDKDPGLLVSLAQTQEAASDLHGAIASMKKYVALRPRDPTGFDYLGRLYMLAGSPDEAMAAMAKRVAIEPSQQSVNRLAGWYRLYGRFGDEAKLLMRMRERRVQLTAFDLTRMGEYLAAKGDSAAAISPLLDADALLPPDQTRGRVLLFEVLVAAGRYDEAVSRALKWLTVWRKPWIAMRLLQSLPARAPERDVLRLSAAVLRLYPDTTLYVAKTLADHGHRSVAVEILSRWAQGEPNPTTAQIGGLVAVVHATGDPTLLWRMLPVILEKPDASEAQGYYIEALAYAFGENAIVSLQTAIPQAAFNARPLFAAALALRTGDQRLALHYLMGVRLADLSSRNQRSWLDLVEQATSQETALKILLAWRSKGELPPDLLPSLAALAGRLGYSGEQMLVLNEIARR